MLQEVRKQHRHLHEVGVLKKQYTGGLSTISTHDLHRGLSITHHGDDLFPPCSICIALLIVNIAYHITLLPIELMNRTVQDVVVWIKCETTENGDEHTHC